MCTGNGMHTWCANQISLGDCGTMCVKMSTVTIHSKHLSTGFEYVHAEKTCWLPVLGIAEVSPITMYH